MAEADASRDNLVYTRLRGLLGLSQSQESSNIHNYEVIIRDVSAKYCNILIMLNFAFLLLNFKIITIQN